MQVDHYQVLGVPPEADEAAIRSAYLRLMRAHHPDHRPGDATSAEVARRVNAAYDVLGDRLRRSAYDRRRLAGSAQAPPPPPGPGWSVDPLTAMPRPRQAPASSYSPDRGEYQRAFSLATARFLLAALALGTLLLLILAPR
jgi:curved DNA-binding protein CbpA